MEPLDVTDPEAVGPYRLLARLGAGGMGRVYLARSSGGRTVAVKVVRSELAEDQEFRSRFAREVAAAQAVDGTYTAPVVDADRDGPMPWLATAYVLGPSLTEAVMAHGPLPEQSVRALGAGLAQALAAVHRAGLVHRDLKPSNVLLAADGPRVIDFGIARAMDGDGFTRTGIVVGSPGYMSPEQASGQPIGPAGDVFALGSVLVYAATGQGPFESASGPAAQLYKVVHDQPDLDGLPASLRPAVAACLAKDPALRPSPEQLTGMLAPDGATAVLRDGWLPAPVTSALAQHAAKVMDMETPARGSAVHSPNPYTPTSTDAAATATAAPGTMKLGRVAPQAGGPAGGPAPEQASASPTVPRPSRRAFLFGGGAVAVAAVGGTAWALTRGHSPSPSPAPSPTGTAPQPVPKQSRPAGVAPQPLWTYDAQGRLTSRPPLVVGGSLCPQGEGLVALDPTTGKEKWARRDVPAIVLVASKQMVITQADTQLVGFAADTGVPRWTFAGKDMKGDSLTPDGLLGADDHAVYTLADLSPAGVMFGDMTFGVTALSLDTQQELWFQERQKSATPFVEGLAAAGNVYYTDNQNNLVARSGQDGKQIWFVDTGVPAAYPAAADATQAYCLTGRTGLQAVRLTDGKQQWKITVPSDEKRMFTPVLAANGVVYGSDGTPSVCGWDAATGKELWRCALPKSVSVMTPPVLVKDTLFVPGGFGGGVFAVDIKAASVRWTFSVEGTSGDDWYLSTDGERLFAQFGPHIYALPPE
ncbi:serine/threonine-protein kinase [Kitasatospora sp. GP82]|uniref:serine/threonine-protein kinase n=1 Tax=Kitasatospora sp. GP82 TaxID=3035089 RepID=UPI0024760845|nr:serine/threonine-protein kinase [Kitasatospora sp. GP82]MDH6123142.1 outer membrane protein assembly factor BamB [Kitasatospora sp. GP82]